jgi:prepilin-type N-terminal cleavage/methylation domain-containing protein
MSRPRPGAHRGVMRPHGHTLVELLVAIAIAAMLLTLSVPPARRWHDGIVVRAARDEIAAALADTRVAAVAAGGAALVLDPTGARFWVRPDGAPPGPPTDLESRYGVRMNAGTGQDEVVLRYDGLGIGRIASRTIRIERGRAAAGLTVSAYGRYRRW